jgi:hypothetical protein
LVSVIVGDTETDPDVTSVADVIVVESGRESRVRSAQAVGVEESRKRADGPWAVRWIAPAARRRATRLHAAHVDFMGPPFSDY